MAATFLFGTATVACNASTANAPVNTASDDDQGAEVAVIEHHRFHHHGGALLFLAMGLDTLGVPAEQRPRVDKIREDLRARLEPSRKAEQNLVSVLYDGIQASHLDEAKVDAAVAQVTAAAMAVHEASADALNELHEALTAPQRAALLDKVESHWEVWLRANAEETGPKSPDGSHLAALASDLDLTPDQENKIRVDLATGLKSVPRLNPSEIAAELKAFSDAFRAEKFDAKTLAGASGANAKMAGWGAAHLARFVETVSPLLTAAQRTKLASTLEAHARHDPSAQGNQ